jgi:hypothetical protein
VDIFSDNAPRVAKELDIFSAYAPLSARRRAFLDLERPEQGALSENMSRRRQKSEIREWEGYGGC